MNGFYKELIDVIHKKKLKQYLLNCNFGLEKESARVDKGGKLVFTPHPEAFGDRLKNPYIKTDFSESQIELSTSVQHTIEDTYSFLENLHDAVCLQLQDEYLWPQSCPPCLPEEGDIPIAKMGDKEEEEFRAALARKYGRKKQMISGIHYNFSFREELIEALYHELSEGKSYREFKNNLYLKVCRNFLKYRWLLIYLTGASPVFHNTFIKKYTEESLRIDDESCYFPNMISLRNSDYGYKNRENFYVSFDSVGGYINDINDLVNKGELQDICEFYGPVRLKTGNNDNLSIELLEYGIKYIELRIFDINPLCKIGISMDTLYITHLFVLYMLFKKEDNFNREDHMIADKNAHLVSFYGMQDSLELYQFNDESRVLFKEKALEILNDMEEMIKQLQIDKENYMELFRRMSNMVMNPYDTYSGRIVQGVKDKSFINFHMEKAMEYLSESRKNVDNSFLEL